MPSGMCTAYSHPAVPERFLISRHRARQSLVQPGDIVDLNLDGEPSSARYRSGSMANASSMPRSTRRAPT